MSSEHRSASVSGGRTRGATEGDGPSPIVPGDSATADSAAEPGAGRYPAIAQLGATAGIIAVSCLLVYWQLRDTFLYAADDLLQFQYAAQYGLSRELLTLNVFGHFGPVDRAGHLLLLQFGLNPTAGALLSTAMVGALLVSVAWLAYELQLSLVRRLLMLAAAGGSLAILENAHWADSALHVFPALTICYLVVALHLRAIRTGRRGWHVLSVVLFPLGLLTQERAAFALPLIVLIDLLLVWNGLPVRRRLINLWSVKWPLIAMGVIGATGAYLIQQNYAVTSLWPTPDLVGRTMLLAFTNYQFPQLVGYQPSTELANPAQWLVLGLCAVVLGALVLLNRWNLGPVLFFLSAFCLYWGFLLFSPILVPDNIGWTASRLGNAVYVLVPALVAAGSLRGPARWTLPAWRLTHPSRWLIASTVAAVTVTCFFTFMGSRWADRDWGPDREANEFFTAVAAARAQWSDPSVTVLPMRGPERIGPANAWSAVYAEHMFLLTLIAPRWRPGELTDKTVVINSRGVVTPVVLEQVAGATPGPGTPEQTSATNVPPSRGTAACLTTETDLDALLYTVTPPLQGEPVFARLTYRIDEPGSMRAVGFDGPAYQAAQWSLPLAKGTHTIVIPLPLVPSLPVQQGRLDGLRLDGLPLGSTLCVSAIDIVRPLLVRPDGACAALDAYAEPTTAVACPPQSPP